MSTDLEPLLRKPAMGEATLKYGSLLVFLIGTVGDQVLIKRATYSAYFPAALTLLTAIVGIVVYPVIVLGALASGHVRRHHILVPLWKPALIAFGFTLHHVLLNVGAASSSVPGIIAMVLAKLVIPVSMLLNMPSFTLALQYQRRHWLSVLLLLFGIVLTVSGPLRSALLTKGLHNKLGNMLLIALSTVPLAAAFTFIEKHLKEHHRDLFTVALWMWICIFQFFMSILLLPLNAVLSRLPMSQMWSDLQQGITCYAGLHTPHSPKAVDCNVAGTLWWTSLCFSLAYNLAMPVSTRYGGAALMWFVRGMAVPLAGLLFTSTVVMGSHAIPMTWPQVVGLFVVTAGVFMFNSIEPRRMTSNVPSELSIGLGERRA